MNLKIVAVTLLFIAASSLAGEKANVEFGPDGITVLNVQPGTKVAWMSLTRVRIASHSQLHIERGIEVATPSRNAKVGRPGADRAHSLWVIASVDDDVAGSATAPGYSESSTPIDVVAKTGMATITIASPEIELMYVRPRRGAWFVSATDGGLHDQDRQQDTAITLSLDTLERVKGNPQPPDATEAGDILLMIDPRLNRILVIKVNG